MESTRWKPALTEELQLQCLWPETKAESSAFSIFVQIECVCYTRPRVFTLDGGRGEGALLPLRGV